MKHLTEIPASLSHLKVDHRGYPIPYFVAVINGEPDFRMVDEKKMIHCADKKLCGICGKKLFEYSYFITGPMGLANGTHSDPPAHKECALFALQACPHLHFEKADRNDRGEIYKERAAKNYTGSMAKCYEVYFIKADKFKMITVKQNTIFKFRVVSSQRWSYQDGILKPDIAA